MLSRLSIDTDGNGRFDYGETYQPSARLWDYNEDGRDDSRETSDGKGGLVREFSTRADGRFDLRILFRGGAIVEVRKSGRLVAATPDAKRGVTWIGRVPETAAVTPSAPRWVSHLRRPRVPGVPARVGRLRGGAAVMRRSAAWQPAARAAAVALALAAFTSCAGSRAAVPVPELPAVRLAEVERQIADGLVAEALQGLDYLRREKAADLPEGSLERLQAIRARGPRRGVRPVGFRRRVERRPAPRTVRGRAGTARSRPWLERKESPPRARAQERGAEGNCSPVCSRASAHSNVGEPAKAELTETLAAALAAGNLAVARTVAGLMRARGLEPGPVPEARPVVCRHAQGHGDDLGEPGREDRAGRGVPRPGHRQRVLHRPARLPAHQPPRDRERGRPRRTRDSPACTCACRATRRSGSRRGSSAGTRCSTWPS